MRSLTPEIIRAEFIEKTGSLDEVAEKLSVPVDRLEAYCFSLCKSDPENFKYTEFITKQWFEEKLTKYSTLVEISNATGIHYRTLCTLKQKFIPERPRHLSKEITREELWQMYVVEEMTDKSIAKRYNTDVASIKRLRGTYDIMASDRTPLENKLPIELFHRMYVVSKLSLSLIATLHNTSRVTLTELRDKYIAMGHPLSQEIADTDNTGYYPRFMGALMQLISKEDLCRELKTKTIYEIAAQYKLIAPTVNSHTPLSKEWLKAELMTKSVKQIASETNMSVSRLYVIISEYGLSEATRTFHIDPNILRELFINRCWSDETIAEHLGVSPATVKRERLSHKILSDQRPPIENRISVEMFRYLFIEERMSLVQIGTAFRVSDAKIRELRKKYVAMGHTELAERQSNRITPERLEFLYKQIHLNLLKK